VAAAAVVGAAGCGAPGKPADPPNVLDLTWGRGWERPSSGDVYADLPADERERKLEYYRALVRMWDGAGRAVKPLDQVSFRKAPPSNAPTGEAAKPAEFVDQRGRRVRLEDWKGKKNLVLVFTRGYPGYICPLCTTYTAQVASRYRDIVAAGAEVLLVFPGSKERVDDFVRAAREILESEGEGALPFPVLLDTELRNVDLFGIRGDLAKPATYVIDRAGAVRYAFVGEQPHERPDVETILAELRRLPGAE